MALPYVVDSLESVDESVREHYVKGNDGKFVLDGTGTPRGFVVSSQHDEMRIKVERLDTDLTKAREDLEKFKGIDPEKARESMETQAQLERAELLKKGDVDTLIQQSVEDALAPMKEQLEAANRERETAQTQLQQSVGNDAILRAGNAMGKLRPGAEDVLIQKARADGFDVVDGELVQIQNGQKVFSQQNAGQARTIDEWMEEVAVPQFEWAWEPSGGGGGGGSNNDDGDRGGGGGDSTTIDPTDTQSYEANLDDIATGKKKVGSLPTGDAPGGI